MARLTHERRHRQILDSAIDVFAEYGFRGTTTKRLAKAAGVSEATIFLHFPSKEALYEAILKELLHGYPLTDVLDDSSDAPIAEVAQALAMRFMEKHPRGSAALRIALFSALEGYSLGRRMAAEHIGGPVQRLTRSIERAQARGEVRADLDPETAARSLDAMHIHQVLMRELLGEDHAPPRDMQAYVDIWLRGVTPRKEEEE